MLPTTFAEATVVRMWKCCQSQCCQFSIGARRSAALPARVVPVGECGRSKLRPSRGAGAEC